MLMSVKWTKIMYVIIIVILVSFVLSMSASAQMKIPDEFTNLKVLPKDISKGELIDLMKSYTRALDVRCNSCHIIKSDRTWDFVSDSLEMKKTTRVMIEMMQSINNSYISKVAMHNDGHSKKVECATCHRGHLEPETLEQVLNNSYRSGGIQATIKKYRDLRDQYYGGAGYDFTEYGILNFVQTTIPDSLANDGIEFLKLNLEYIEKPLMSHFTMANIYSRNLQNKEMAISHLEKCLEINPEFQIAQMMLDNLKK